MRKLAWIVLVLCILYVLAVPLGIFPRTWDLVLWLIASIWSVIYLANTSKRLARFDKNFNETFRGGLQKTLERKARGDE